MKTNNSVTSSMNPLQETSGISRFARFGRLSLAATCVSLASFTAAPLALAAAPDGSYEFESASGKLRYDGDSVSIPKSIMKKIAYVVDGDIVIKDSKLKVVKKGTVDLIEDFGDEINADVEASVKGPSKVVLSKVGPSRFSGETTSDVVTTFEGDFFGEDFSGELRTNVAATVYKKTLTIVITFAGEAEGEDFSGKVTIVAKR